MEGRLRLDAGTWGTMGVGLGYAIAAATCTDRLVVAVEGDSAFGFSGMEIETIVRSVILCHHHATLRKQAVYQADLCWKKTAWPACLGCESTSPLDDSCSQANHT